MKFNALHLWMSKTLTSKKFLDPLKAPRWQYIHCCAKIGLFTLKMTMHQLCMWKHLSCQNIKTKGIWRSGVTLQENVALTSSSSTSQVTAVIKTHAAGFVGTHWHCERGWEDYCGSNCSRLHCWPNKSEAVSRCCCLTENNWRGLKRLVKVKCLSENPERTASCWSTTVQSQT